MNSGINKSIRKPFLVDENALRRIVGVLEKHAKDLGFPTEIIYRVEREDDRFYETNDLSEVTSDPNIDGKRVTNLSVKLVKIIDNGELESFHGWLVRVTFDSEPKDWVYALLDKGIRFEIDNREKNWSLLLADALEPQIERTINQDKVPRLPIIGLIVVAVYLCAKLLSLMDGGDALVQSFMMAVVFVCGGVFAVVHSRGSALIISRMIGPETAFLWGQQEERFQVRQQRRKNIFWCVFVAFIVSTGSSVFLGFFS